MSSLCLVERVSGSSVSGMLFVESQLDDGCLDPNRFVEQGVELLEAFVEVSEHVFVLQVLVYEHFGAETLSLALSLRHHFLSGCEQ